MSGMDNLGENVTVEERSVLGECLMLKRGLILHGPRNHGDRLEYLFPLEAVRPSISACPGSGSTYILPKKNLSRVLLREERAVA